VFFLHFLEIERSGYRIVILMSKKAFAGDKKVGRSLLAGSEDVLKAWLLPMVPKWLETYHLTLSTVIWSLLIVLFSFLARFNIKWMWLTSLMIVFQYITDLLDGAVGRKRNTGLIKWGYYMDHFLDYIFLCSILIGYSMLVRDYNKYVLFFVLALFGAYMVNSFLSFAATNEFKIAYLGIGPTEIRLIFIIANALLILSKNNMMVERAIPFVLGFSAFGLFITVYRTQEMLWRIDMKNKEGGETEENAVDTNLIIKDIYEGVSVRRIVFKLLIVVVLVVCAFCVLMLKIGYPYYRVLAGALYIASWIPFVKSSYERRALFRKHREKIKKSLLRYVSYPLVAFLLIICAYAGWVLAPMDDTPLTDMSEDEIARNIEDDVRNMKILISDIETAEEWIKEQGIFKKPVDRMLFEEKRAVKEFWRDYLAKYLELDILQSKYRGFHRIDYLVRKDLHSNAFFMGYAAFVLQYSSMMRLVSLLEDNEFLEVLLNEKNTDLSIPARSLFSLKQRLTHPKTLLFFNMGQLYLQQVRDDLTCDPDLVSAVDKYVSDVSRRLGKNADMLIKNPLELLEKTGSTVWLPFQKEVALQMSYMRATKRENFVDVGIISEHKNKLEPGDLMLERRNWYMTNIGIPGFWPHLAMYIGTIEEMSEYFKDVKALKGSTVSEYLMKKYPDVYAGMSAPDENGFSKSVIESIKPGVVLASVERSANADYWAVLRPRLSKEQKFRAIMRAFSYLGRPYDYNFDFVTDGELVCSELIYKAYADIKGLTLTPAIMNGRMILPPNSFAQKFAEEYSTDRQELDFVLFLDGNEDSGTAFEKGVEEFILSWKRPKWDIMQE